jgi:hypothetical protein
MGSEARAVAPGGRKLGDGARQRGAETWQMEDALELRTVEAARGSFHHEIERRAGDFRRIRGVAFDESIESLDDGARKNETFARQLVLQVLRQGCSGHQQTDGVVAGAQGIAELGENRRGFAGTWRAGEEAHQRDTMPSAGTAMDRRVLEFAPVISCNFYCIISARRDGGGVFSDFAGTNPRSSKWLVDVGVARVFS